MQGATELANMQQICLNTSPVCKGNLLVSAGVQEFLSDGSKNEAG